MLTFNGTDSRLDRLGGGGGAGGAGGTESPLPFVVAVRVEYPESLAPSGPAVTRTRGRSGLDRFAATFAIFLVSGKVVLEASS